MDRDRNRALFQLETIRPWRDQRRSLDVLWNLAGKPKAYRTVRRQSRIFRGSSTTQACWETKRLHIASKRSTVTMIKRLKLAFLFLVAGALFSGFYGSRSPATADSESKLSVDPVASTTPRGLPAWGPGPLPVPTADGAGVAFKPQDSQAQTPKLRYAEQLATGQ